MISRNIKNSRTYNDPDEDNLTHNEHIQKMLTYYSNTSHLYNTWHCDPNNSSSHNFAVRELVKLSNKLNAKSILDVCCGTGRALRNALDQGIDAYGIDISPDLINRAVSELDIPRNRLSVGDATTMPFNDSQFDICCILGALHHTAQPKAIISEMLRISKKGVIVSDEGNHFSGGIKSILLSFGLFEPVYRVLFRRPPRKARRRTNSEGDGPAFVFSVEEVIPQIREKFPVIKTLTFYKFFGSQTCAFWYPRLFAKQVIVIATK